MTVREAYPLFISYGRAERNYAAETLTKHRDCFSVWILPNLGDVELAVMSRLDVLALRSRMADKGVGIDRHYGVLTTLKVFLKFCREVLKVDCLDPDSEVRLPQRPKPHVHFLSNAEVERLQDAININTFTGLRMRILVEVLLTTGLRISEALSLDRQPFEAGEDEIEITGKGGKRRTVFFPSGTLQWVKKLLYRRVDDHPAVFVTTGIPRRLDRSDMSKYFAVLKQRAGIVKPLTPHILRHTYCTNLLQNGADITYIKELAGHADIQTTAKYYLGVDRKALRSVVARCLNYKSPPPVDTNSGQS